MVDDVSFGDDSDKEEYYELEQQPRNHLRYIESWRQGTAFIDSDSEPDTDAEISATVEAKAKEDFEKKVSARAKKGVGNPKLISSAELMQVSQNSRILIAPQNSPVSDGSVPFDRLFLSYDSRNFLDDSSMTTSSYFLATSALGGSLAMSPSESVSQRALGNDIASSPPKVKEPEAEIATETNSNLGDEDYCDSMFRMEL